MFKAYYAHCIHLYGTPQERRDVMTLEALGFDVINPNSEDVHVACNRIRAEVADDPTKDPGGEVMRRVFRPLMREIDVLAFRALPDGRIPSGVAQEIEWARENGKPVFELPGNMLGRVMNVDETREYLHEVGQR